MMAENPMMVLDQSVAQTIPVAGANVKFGADDGFYRELRRRVEQYFRNAALRERDCPKMYVKTALVLSWLAASYILLVFFAASWWSALLLTVSLGLSMAAVGFNIQHDGGHHAYSNHRWVNRLMALTLDLLGGSSYIWARKHNTIHHSFSNITGHDDDIELGPMGRLSPHQKHFGFHRVQHFYLWILYGFMPIKWHLVDDFRAVIRGRIGEHRFARPTGWDLVILVGGKVLFFTLAFVIPLWLHPAWIVVVLYLTATYLLGLSLSIVFQLAHCVEQADFPMPREDTGRIETGWAAHQVQTTVDFAHRNRLLSWFIGGLNYQIEHHLFPQICHVHYRRLAPLVEQTCREFGLRYAANDTFLAALASHFRWLRRMGTAAAA